MNIIEFPTHYQVNCLLERKKTNKIYNVFTCLPSEIQDISKDEIDIIAIKFSKKNEQNFLIPYVEYNGELYEPYMFWENNIGFKNKIIKDDFYLAKIEDFISNSELDDVIKIDDFFIFTGLSPQECQEHILNENIFYHTLFTDKSCEEIGDKIIKKYHNDNKDYIHKKVHDFADNLLFIDNQLFRKTYGPFLKKSYTQPYSTYQNNNCCTPINKYFNIENKLDFLIPYSLSGHMKSATDEYGKIANKDNKFHYVIFNPEKLHEITKGNLGYFLFTMTFESIQNAIQVGHFKEYKNKSELQLSTWFKHLENKYEFGKDLTSYYQMCIDSNYDFDIVIETIEMFKNHINNMNMSNISVTSMQQYLNPEDKNRFWSNYKKKLQPDRKIMETVEKVFERFDNIKDVYNFKKDINNVYGDGFATSKNFQFNISQFKM